MNFTVQIPHFTRYEFDDQKEDDEKEIELIKEVPDSIAKMLKETNEKQILKEQ